MPDAEGEHAGPRPGASIAVGLAAGFVAAAAVVRWIRPRLLADADPSWASARLTLGLLAVAAAAAAGVALAALFWAFSRLRAARAPLEPLALRSGTLVALAAVAVLAGTGLRVVSLSRVPEVLWVDDLSLIAPALSLEGSPRDFRDAIRATPYGVPRPYGTIGVLYLEGYRALLDLAGTTVLGVRLPSALAGIASLVTAALLGRALLPSGGGALTALILAGLRWHLILSRWAFNMIVLAPIVDVATLLLLSARRRGRVTTALAAGAVAGLGAHVYLSAWPAAAALALFALWPASPGEPGSSRALRAALFGLGFAACAAPLFLLRDGRTTPYFARTADHNVVLEMRRERSVLPPVFAAAEALASPWRADPSPRHDLPGRRRLGWIYGIPVTIALGRALLRPREPLSGLLLAHGAAYLAAVVAGGQADNPNGSRFGYLATLTAVAAAAGTLWLVGLVRPPRRRAAALAAVGAIAASGLLSARDVLVTWSAHPETFRGFHGEDTRIGRAAARWEPYGALAIEPGVGRSRIAVEAVRRYRLDPDLPAEPPRPGGPLRIRIAPAGETPAAGERLVERIEDPEGRVRAVVLASRAGR